MVNVRSVLSERGTVPTLAARSVAQVSALTLQNKLSENLQTVPTPIYARLKYARESSEF